MPSLTAKGSTRGAAPVPSTLVTADGQAGWNAALKNYVSRDISSPPPDRGPPRTTPGRKPVPPRDGDIEVDPALGWRKWRLVQGGLLPGGGSLTIGEDPGGYPTTPYDQLAVRNAVIDSQRRTNAVASRIMGPWDAKMIEGGIRIFGFGPQEPSWREKEHLARNFQAMALGLRRNVRVNLCHRHELAGADGFVPRAGSVYGDIHIALEYIRDPKTLPHVGLCLLHEIGHQTAGLRDTGYINKPAFFDNGVIRYEEGVRWPLYNADSYAAFVYFIT
jgi:hypothetical protein